jgi:hypothetical protein
MSDGSNVHIVHIVSRYIERLPKAVFGGLLENNYSAFAAEKNGERTSEVSFNKESPKRDGRFGPFNYSAGL